MDNASFGRNVKMLRTNKKMTIEQLAEKSELSEDTIWKLENGRNTTSLSGLIRICDALETTPSLLLEEYVPSINIESEYCKVFEDILELTSGEFERINDIVDIILDKKSKKKS